MKVSKHILLTTALVLISGAAFAQTSDSDNATVAAEVLAVIDVSNQEDIDFGLISPNISVSNPFLDPANSGNDANVAGTQTVGRFHITGTTGQDILFGASNFAVVNVVSGTNNEYAFDYTPNMYGTANTLSSDARGSSGAVISSGGTGTLTGGQFTVWVGGTLDNPVDNFQTSGDNTTNALVAGAYSATYTLTIDYD